MSGPVVGFAGLSHLGLVSAAAAASKGFEVVAYGRHVDVVARRGRDDLLWREPGLEELVKASGARLRFTADIGDLAEADLVYLSEDVPTDRQGESDVAPINSLADAVIGALRTEALFVVLSQVAPGFTRRLALDPARTFYQVETLVFGQAVARALSPERIVIGCADPLAQLPDALQSFLAAFRCPVLPMAYESAELCKISINVCLAATVTAANTLAELCEGLGAQWLDIEPALRLDRRIGQHAYLRAGLGIAGGNIERDLVTVASLAARVGSDAGLVRSALANSRHRRDWALREIHDRILATKPDPVFGVLGLAYKEDTASIKNSPAIDLITALTPFEIQVYDPVVTPPADLHPRLTAAGSALAAAKGADALVVMTPWPEFRTLNVGDLAVGLRGRVVVDPFNVLDRATCAAAGLDHVTLGAPSPAHA